jgi:hypothetical protein
VSQCCAPLKRLWLWNSHRILDDTCITSIPHLSLAHLASGLWGLLPLTAARVQKSLQRRKERGQAEFSPISQPRTVLKSEKGQVQLCQDPFSPGLVQPYGCPQPQATEGESDRTGNDKGQSGQQGRNVDSWGFLSGQVQVPELKGKAPLLWQPWLATRLPEQEECISHGNRPKVIHSRQDSKQLPMQGPLHDAWARFVLLQPSRTRQSPSESDLTPRSSAAQGSVDYPTRSKLREK